MPPCPPRPTLFPYTTLFRALGLHALVADAREALVHQVALLAIRPDVDHLVAHLGHDPLPQRRRVDEAEDTARERAGLEELGRLRHARGEGQVADALAGDRQIGR